jgi:hypothetical protein
MINDLKEWLLVVIDIEKILASANKFSLERMAAINQGVKSTNFINNLKISKEKMKIVKEKLVLLSKSLNTLLTQRKIKCYNYFY